MFYRFRAAAGYIQIRQIERNPIMKGKTMTPNKLIHVIWDFPARIFNMGREKLVQQSKQRAQDDARWFNG